jgi:hypothetical protein
MAPRCDGISANIFLCVVAPLLTQSLFPTPRLEIGHSICYSGRAYISIKVPGVRVFPAVNRSNCVRGARRCFVDKGLTAEGLHTSPKTGGGILAFFGEHRRISKPSGPVLARK